MNNSQIWDRVCPKQISKYTHILKSAQKTTSEPFRSISHMASFVPIRRFMVHILYATIH